MVAYEVWNPPMKIRVEERLVRVEIYTCDGCGVEAEGVPFCGHPGPPQHWKSGREYGAAGLLATPGSPEISRDYYKICDKAVIRPVDWLCPACASRWGVIVFWVPLARAVEGVVCFAQWARA